jgi:hypothetical protein
MVERDVESHPVEGAMAGTAGSGGVAALDTPAADRSGRASALTTLSALPRRWSPVLKLALRIKSWLGPDPTLRRLSFIHVAHWVVIDHFPLEQRPSRYSYLLFVSNFNGSWFDYLDVFSTVVPQKMVLLWGTSYGFPGARPPRPFDRVIRASDQPLDHYYAAYPGATTTEIASALRVRERFHTQVTPAAALDAPQLAQAWRGFVDDVQRDL